MNSYQGRGEESNEELEALQDEMDALLKQEAKSKARIEGIKEELQKVQEEIDKLDKQQPEK